MEVGRSTGTAAGRVLTRPRRRTSRHRRRNRRAATQASPATQSADRNSKHARQRNRPRQHRQGQVARAVAPRRGQRRRVPRPERSRIAVRTDADRPPSSSERFAAAAAAANPYSATRSRCGCPPAGIATSAAVSKEPPERRSSIRYRQSVFGTDVPPTSMRIRWISGSLRSQVFSSAASAGVRQPLRTPQKKKTSDTSATHS